MLVWNKIKYWMRLWRLLLSYCEIAIENEINNLINDLLCSVFYLYPSDSFNQKITKNAFPIVVNNMNDSYMSEYYWMQHVWRHI